MRFQLLPWLLIMMMTYQLPGGNAKVRLKEHRWRIRNTDFILSYKTVAFIAHQTNLVFAVKGDRDGHILLSHDRNLTGDGYEYVIGQTFTTPPKSFPNALNIFRKPIWGERIAYKVVMNMLHPKRYRWFWLDWSDGNYLKAGTGDDPGDPSTMIMSTPLTVKSLRFLSFSAFGNTLFYKIVKDRYPCLRRIEKYNENDDNNCIHKLPGVHYTSLYNPEYNLNASTYKTIGYIGASTSLLILVKAERDGHVVVSPSKNLTMNLYEYVIGGADDQQTVLRSAIYSGVLETTPQRHTMDKYQYKWFWLDWTDGATIRLGVGSKPHTCMSKTLEGTRQVVPDALQFVSVSAFGNMVKYKIPKAANRCYLSLEEFNNRQECGANVNAKTCILLGCCWDSQANFCYLRPHSEYSWSIHNPFFNIDTLTYETIGYVGGMTSLVIQIKGDRDGHVLLTEDTLLTSHIMEWVIGGNNDTETILRSPIYGTNLVADYNKPNTLSGQNYNYFWLEWDGNFLNVGSGSILKQSQWLSIALNPNRKNFKYVSLSAFGNTVHYRIVKANNQCFLTLEEYRNRVECGDNVNESDCLSLSCCWDKFDNFCYFRSSG